MNDICTTFVQLDWTQPCDGILITFSIIQGLEK